MLAASLYLWAGHIYYSHSLPEQQKFSTFPQAASSLSFLRLVCGTPAPADCELYHVDRDALFSGHALSEAFLQSLMALYTAAHYRNQPNDLQMLSDAPAHLLFVLLGPRADDDSSTSHRLPDILCIIQVALEGV